MRRTAIVVVCLCGLMTAQGNYTGAATWLGGGIWGAGFQSGAQSGDLPLPDFTLQGGMPLILPQQWVDPMEAFTQSIDNTVYVGNVSNGCPNAPARTNYLGQSKSSGQCDFYDTTGAGLTQVASDWAALSGGSYDQRWDVVVTHGTTYNFGNSAWIWPTKYNGTHATKYLVVHSDCTASNPCTGTNDVGYNPLGRTVCSHGINDYGLTPPLPDAGQRNHGCQGYLGLPGVDAPVPITSASYSYDSNYNDLANMFTITSSVTVGVDDIDMGPAALSGGLPVEGVNHIWITDAHFTTGQSSSNNGRIGTPINILAQEWTNLMPDTWLPAAPNHVGFSQIYIDGQTNDDGFGTQKIQKAILLSCAYCAISHSYIDGIKADGKEHHGINLDDAPGPVMVVHNWCEAASCLWGGGGNWEGIYDHRSQNLEIRRDRLTYPPRWVESVAGNQTLNKKVVSGQTDDSCSGSTLSLHISNGSSSNPNITNATAVYLSKIKDSGGNGVCGGGTCEGWYTATALDSSHVAVTVSSCTGTPASGAVYGWDVNYLGPVNVVSAAALNAAGYDGTMNNPVLKNLFEAKEYAQILGDGFICENGAVGGQNGECFLNQSGGGASVGPGYGAAQTQIHDVTLTNFIMRHSVMGFNQKGRLAGASLGTYPITSISCNGTTSATVVATGMNGALMTPATFLPDLTRNCSANGNTPCTGPSFGLDVFLTGVGAGLIPDGWYTTSYPTNGSYGNDAGVTIWADQNHAGPVCTVNNGTASTGTIYGIKGSNGNGVNWPTHRTAYINALVYGIGDYNISNGSSVQMGGREYCGQ